MDVQDLNSVKLTVSDRIYWGFRVSADLDAVRNSRDTALVAYVKDKMHSFFNSHGLQVLAAGIDSLDLHVHSRPLIGPGTQIWLCSHDENPLTPSFGPCLP